MTDVWREMIKSKEMIILIHTSKTMRPAAEKNIDILDTPVLFEKALELATYSKSLSAADIQKTMHVSEKLAVTTRELFAKWSNDPTYQRAAVDSFLGDIYSGMQVQDWSAADREYAHKYMRILSGLYGVLRPLDGISPYRLEMGYKLPDERYRNLYDYWDTAIVDTLPSGMPIVDLSAVEYGKTVTKYVDSSLVTTPRFLTISPKTGEPIFVVVHAKIARGAFASWMIRNRVDDTNRLKEFDELGYSYDVNMSTPAVPVFVCKDFGGIGLSVRLSEIV